MVSDELIEKAARAMCRYDCREQPERFESEWAQEERFYLGFARAALEAALSSAQAPEWQPIETAPKDGTVISIKGDRGPYGVAAWEGHASWGTPVNWHRDSSTWLAPSDRPELKGAVLHLAGYVPTHWQPALPASPQPPAGKQ